MAWTDPSGGSAVTGGTALASEWNTYLIDNQLAAFPDDVSGVAWSPTLEGTTTDPVIATVTGVKFRIGPLQFVWAAFIHDDFDGSSSGGSGSFFVTLPVAASGLDDSTNGGGGQAIGSWQGRDDDTPASNEGGAVQLRTTTTVMFNRASGGVVTNTTPFTWETGDVFSFHAIYPVA